MASSPILIRCLQMLFGSLNELQLKVFQRGSKKTRKSVYKPKVVAHIWFYD